MPSDSRFHGFFGRELFSAGQFLIARTLRAWAWAILDFEDSLGWSSFLSFGRKKEGMKECGDRGTKYARREEIFIFFLNSIGLTQPI